MFSRHENGFFGGDPRNTDSPLGLIPLDGMLEGRVEQPIMQTIVNSITILVA
jgi:hypothetical protein